MQNGVDHKSCQAKIIRRGKAIREYEPGKDKGHAEIKSQKTKKFCRHMQLINTKAEM